jgi:hypothetical protein
MLHEALSRETVCEWIVATQKIDLRITVLAHFRFQKVKKNIYFYFSTAFLKKYSKIVYLAAIVFRK